MNWIGEICIFIAGLLLSTVFWLQCLWKTQEACKTKEKELAATQDRLLDEKVEYVSDRERTILLYNSFAERSEQAEARFSEVEEREKALREMEAAFLGRENGYQSKISKLEGELKACREGKRRRRTKKKKDNTPPSVSP